MTTDNDLTGYTDEELAAEQANILDAIDGLARERTRLQRRLNAIKAEARRRALAATAHTQPPYVDVTNVTVLEGGWARVRDELVERFPVGATVRYGDGKVRWRVVYIASVNVCPPAVELRNPDRMNRSVVRWVQGFELGKLTRIDDEPVGSD